MNLNEDLAFAAAWAYAESPVSSKNDPAVFGKAVRAVYDAAMDNPTDPVGVRYNTPHNITTRAVMGDVIPSTRIEAARVFVREGYFTEYELSELLRVFKNHLTQTQGGFQS